MWRQQGRQCAPCAHPACFSRQRVRRAVLRALQQLMLQQEQVLARYAPRVDTNLARGHQAVSIAPLEPTRQRDRHRARAAALALTRQVPVHRAAWDVHRERI